MAGLLIRYKPDIRNIKYMVQVNAMFSFSMQGCIHGGGGGGGGVSGDSAEPPAPSKLMILMAIAIPCPKNAEMYILYNTHAHSTHT